jgi:hypothetical protein
VIGDRAVAGPGAATRHRAPVETGRSHCDAASSRYRYYVSRPLISKDQADESAGLRIPAEEIEQLRGQQSAPMASRS